MFKLNSISSAGKKRKRIGRGGGRGGTSGRGHKGQNARSGGSVGPLHEGGQMPLVRRLPKRGFNNARFRKVFVTINLDRLNKYFEEGTVITKDVFIEKGIINKDDLIKILGDGVLEKKLTVHADAISRSARESITNRGGEVILTQEM